MNNAFIFETEEQESYPQGEYSYEDMEGDFEAEDYEDYEDFEATQYEDPEMEEVRVRDHRRGGGAGRAWAPRPYVRPGQVRSFARPGYRFRPGVPRYRFGRWGNRPRWWGNRYRPYGWRRGYGAPYYGGA